MAKLSREEQHATAFYSKGPYTAHNAITCAVVRGPDDFRQTTVTTLGAHRLAELLNHVDQVVSRYTADISPNLSVDVKEIVAHAVAKSIGWRLETPSDRRVRLEPQAPDAEQAGCA